MGSMVNISRPGKWGNSFKIGRDGTRVEVVAKYKTWLDAPEQGQFREDARKELQGIPRDEYFCLGCKGTEPCHGTPLWEVANA